MINISHFYLLFLNTFRWHTPIEFSDPKFFIDGGIGDVWINLEIAEEISNTLHSKSIVYLPKSQLDLFKMWLEKSDRYQRIIFCEHKQLRDDNFFNLSPHRRLGGNSATALRSKQFILRAIMRKFKIYRFNEYKIRADFIRNIVMDITLRDLLSSNEVETVVICPDTSQPERDLSEKQLRSYVEAIRNIKPVEIQVISDRSFTLQSNIEIIFSENIRNYLIPNALYLCADSMLLHFLYSNKKHVALITTNNKHGTFAPAVPILKSENLVSD